MNSKHRGDKVSRTSSPWEPSMSFSEPLRYLRSRSTVRAARHAASYARYGRIDAERLLLRAPRQDPSRRSLPATLARSAWRASVRIASTALMSCSDILFALLCWITAHFLAGCANYAQAMYLVPLTPDDAAGPNEPVQPAGKATDRTSRLAPVLQMDHARGRARCEKGSTVRGGSRLK